MDWCTGKREKKTKDAGKRMISSYLTVLSNNSKSFLSVFPLYFTPPSSHRCAERFGRSEANRMKCDVCSQNIYYRYQPLCCHIHPSRSCLCAHAHSVTLQIVKSLHASKMQLSLLHSFKAHSHTHTIKQVNGPLNDERGLCSEVGPPVKTGFYELCR